MSILYNMTIFSVYPIEIITGEWGAIQILPVPCPPTYRGCTVFVILVILFVILQNLKSYKKRMLLAI